MKYDLTRCNNLNFKLGNGTTGFIKIPPEGNCYLYRHDETWDGKSMTQKPRFWSCMGPKVFNEYVEENELVIVPRDPETYTEWKVGDILKDKVNQSDMFIIQATLGDVVIISDITRYYGYTYTSKCITQKCKLVLTDYEQEILKAQDEKKAKECPFRKGDRVLVRDEDEDAWIFETFDSYEGGNEYPYDCKEDVHKQCIPYNEKTWKLLGTTDEYKEE